MNKGRIQRPTLKAQGDWDTSIAETIIPTPRFPSLAIRRSFLSQFPPVFNSAPVIFQNAQTQRFLIHQHEMG